jgi:hypothetical protein
LDRKLTTTLLCKEKYFCEIQRSENGCNLTESPKEGYGSKRAVLPVMMETTRVSFGGTDFLDSIHCVIV